LPGSEIETQMQSSPGIKKKTGKGTETPQVLVEPGSGGRNSRGEIRDKQPAKMTGMRGAIVKEGREAPEELGGPQERTCFSKRREPWVKKIHSVKTEGDRLNKILTWKPHARKDAKLASSLAGGENEIYQYLKKKGSENGDNQSKKWLRGGVSGRTRPWNRPTNLTIKKEYGTGEDPVGISLEDENGRG